MRIWERILKELQDFGREICKTLGEDLQGFARLWERICKDLQDFGGARICETLGEKL